MRGLLPVMRVNYNVFDLIKAIFITNNKNFYRKQLSDYICKFFHVNDVVLTSSGRNGIFLLLKNLPQNKVIIPAYTCGVVVEAAMLANKTIIYSHVTPNSINTNFDDVEIDEDSIIIATHQYGNPCSIKQLANRSKLAKAILIEDCAGALGSRVDGVLVGTFGDYGVFSFSASKTVQSPTKGGFIVAKEDNNLQALKKINTNYECCIKDKIRILCKGVGFCLNNNSFFCRFFTKFTNHGNTNDNYTNDPSYHYGFYEWQAYVVLKQFEMIEGIIDQRQQMALLYKKELHQTNIKMVDFDKNAVLIRFPILTDKKNEIRRKAFEAGIQLGGGYDKVYCSDEKEFEDDRAICKRIIYLPMGYRYSVKEQKRVIDFINNISL